MRVEVRSSRAEIVSLSGNDHVFLVHNAPLERLLFDRNLIELAFRETCMDASRLFIRHIQDELVGKDVAELMILSKGIAYRLVEAYGLETGQNLPVNLIATTRVSVNGDDAKIDVPYARLDAGGDTLVIGDTVASGATVMTALDEYTQSHEVRSIYVMSYAGSGIGASRLIAYCRSRGIQVTILYGLAAFGLGDNGFDLSFLHRDTVACEEYIERARRLYSNQPISAVGWDFGAQAIAPRKYRELSWIESRLSGIGGDALREISPPRSLELLWREKDAFSSWVEDSMENE